MLVLAERWQIAQKLHAVSEQFSDGRENPRFRDLIDLQLLEALDPDLAMVRDACERVFGARDQHAWPPTITVQPSWRDAYRAMADDLDVPVNYVDEAVGAVGDFSARIAAT